MVPQMWKNGELKIHLSIMIKESKGAGSQEGFSRALVCSVPIVLRTLGRPHIHGMEEGIRPCSTSESRNNNVLKLQRFTFNHSLGMGDVLITHRGRRRSRWYVQ